MDKSISIIQNYIANSQFLKAKNHINILLESHPNDITLIKLLAHVHGLQEDFFEAIKIIKKAIINSPGDFDFCNNLGFYYFKIEDIDTALEYINKAKSINPNVAAPYYTSAEIKIFQRQFDKAEEEINKCISINKKNFSDYHRYVSALLLKIQIFISRKDVKGVVNFILQYLDESFHSELFLQLVQIDKKSVSNNLIQKCNSLIMKNTYQSKLEKFQYLVPLYFSLANLYERDDKKLSEEFYVKANTEVFNIQRLNLIEYQKNLNQIMSKYDQIKKIPNKIENDGINNFFIVGLPRSGTTLLESILTANKDTFPGGELRSFIIHAKKNLLNKEDIDEDNISKVAQNYLKVTEQIKGEKKYLVDKMPMNSNFIGYILSILPSSKIILLIRDPWDVAISLYKQRYITNVPYSSSFFNIGVQLANFEASIQFWRKKISKFDTIVKTIKYEDLVSKTEVLQQDLYQYCNIKSGFMPEMREKFFARTASMNQVQQDVHQYSIKKTDFSMYKSEFKDALLSQREFWKNKDIEFNNDFLGYNF